MDQSICVHQINQGNQGGQAMSTVITLPREEVELLLQASDYATINLCHRYQSESNLREYYWEKLQNLARVASNVTKALEE